MESRRLAAEDLAGARRAGQLRRADVQRDCGHRVSPVGAAARTERFVLQRFDPRAVQRLGRFVRDRDDADWIGERGGDRPAKRAEWRSRSGMGWADNGWGVLGVNVYFATTGSHTLRIQQREDGAMVDQIVLSPNTYLTTPPGGRQNDATILTESPGS